MKKKLDIETVYDKYTSAFYISVNKYIDLINQEKDDLIKNKPIQAWYQETLDEEAKNFDIFGMVNTRTLPPTINGNVTASNFEIEFIMFFPNGQEKKDVLRRRLLRYARAFREAAKENWNKIAGLSYVEVQDLDPVPANINSSVTYKVLGIAISFQLVDN